MKRAVLCLAGLILLEACAGDPLNVFAPPDRESRSPFYAPHLVQYVAREGTFPVVIHGNPLAVPKAHADAAIAEHLRLPAWTSGARFVTVADQVSRQSLRLVVIFDPAGRRLRGNSACAAPSTIPMAPTGKTIAMLALFCNANEALSEALAIGPTPRDAADPRLQDVLDRVTRVVFAYDYPNRPRGAR